MSKSLGNVINPTDVMRGRSLAQLRRDLESSQLSKSEIERYFFYYESKKQERVDLEAKQR